MLGTSAISLIAVWGARSHDQCSDPECSHKLPTGVEFCPGCRRRIVGEIADPKDRLDAEERLLDASEREG